MSENCRKRKSRKKVWSIVRGVSLFCWREETERKSGRELRERRRDNEGSVPYRRRLFSMKERKGRSERIERRVAWGRKPTGPLSRIRAERGYRSHERDPLHSYSHHDLISFSHLYLRIKRVTNAPDDRTGGIVHELNTNLGNSSSRSSSA